MSTYFDRSERELVRAAARAFPAGGTRAGRRWRLLAIAAAVCTVAAPAMALTRPWEPVLGDPDYGRPATTSKAAPPQAQLDLLQVLRRDTTAGDRGPATQAALQFVGTAASGVHTQHIRRLASLPGGEAVVLVPADRYDPVPEEPGQAIAHPLCVIFPDPGAGAAKTCLTTEEVRAGRPATLGDIVYGLVPDGVAQVRVGESAVQVRDNFFLLRAHSEVAGDVRWFDADGEAIGPPHP